MTQKILYCVLQILNHGPESRSCHAVESAPLVAYAVQEARREYASVPSPVLTALIAHESGFRVNARGALGEIGLTQLLRGGALGPSFATVPDRVLYSPRVNVLLGARYLYLMQRICGRRVEKWLSAFNGRGCRRSEYSDAVLALLAPRSAPKFVLASR